MDFDVRMRLYEGILEKYPAYRKTLSECAAKLKTDGPDSSKIFLCVFAPALTAYISWLIKKAGEDGIKRLYFLARDGWMMKRCAEILAEGQIECRYLEVSRYSMRSAQYHLLREKSVDLLCSGGIDITFAKIMRRSNLTREEAELTAKETGYEEKQTDILHVGQLSELKAKLKSSKAFLERVYAHSKEKYPSARAFLERSGILDNVPFAIVDSGWIGTLQQSIAMIAGRKIKGYYYGLYEIPEDADPSDYSYYYFGPVGYVKRKTCFSNSLFETVFSAPEGMTIGYTGMGEPVFDKNKNPNRGKLLREEKLMAAFAEAFRRHRKEAAKEDALQMTEELFSAAMARPGTTELEAFGNRIFCDDILEMQPQPVAAELSGAQIKRVRVLNKALTVAGIRKKAINESAWLEGSILRASRNVKSDLRHAAFYKTTLYKRQERRNKR